MSVQRRLDFSSAGISGTFAPSATSDASSSNTASESSTAAVSSRTVGLAELFALTAAQPSAENSTVQRLAESEPPAEPTVQSAEASASPAPTAAPAAGGGLPAAPTAAELEDIAQRLYEPMASRIRAELWQDRERAGLLTDLRP